MVRRIACRLALLAVLVAVAPAATVARGQGATDPAGTRPLAVAPAVGATARGRPRRGRPGHALHHPVRKPGRRRSSRRRRGAARRPRPARHRVRRRDPRAAPRLRLWAGAVLVRPRPARPSFRANAQAYRRPSLVPGTVHRAHQSLVSGRVRWLAHVHLPRARDAVVRPGGGRPSGWTRTSSRCRRATCRGCACASCSARTARFALTCASAVAASSSSTLKLRAPFPCSDLAQPEEAFLVFRPGAARVIVGGRGPRIFGRNARRAPAARPLCRGRWIGFFGGTPFRFTVR